MAMHVDESWGHNTALRIHDPCGATVVAPDTNNSAAIDGNSRREWICSRAVYDETISDQEVDDCFTSRYIVPYHTSQRRWERRATVSPLVLLIGRWAARTAQHERVSLDSTECR